MSDSDEQQKFRPQTEEQWEQLRHAAYYNICDRCMSSKNLDVYRTSGLPKMLCDDCANSETSIAGPIIGLLMMAVMILSIL